MALALDRIRFVVPDNVITRDVDGTTVVLDIDTGRSFTLDEIGTRVWTLMTTTRSAQEAFERLVDEYAAEPSEIRTDVESLLGELTANGLLDQQPL